MFTGIRICPAVLALGVALLAGTASAQAPPSPGGAAAWPPSLADARRAAPSVLAQALRPTPAEPSTPSAAPRPAAQPAPLPISVLLQVGAGRLLQLPQPALTVLAADPRIARVQPASPTSLFVMAVGTGRTTVIATAEDGTPVAEYDITVQPGPGAAPPTGGAAAGAAAMAPAAPSAAAVQSMIRRLVRGAERLTVTAAGPRTLVLGGELPAAADAQRAETIARTYGGEDREVVNNITLLSSIQVNLRVRVAEISRQVTRELGFNWDALANDGGGLLIGITTAGATGTLASRLARTATTRAAPGGFDINAVVDALASDQLISILAEPNLTAQSGEVASFLAGGEFPVPIAASPVSNSITIDYKQFGVSLAFVPTVLGPDRLNLRVRPEVSELSDNGAITMPLASGVVRIPALSVRRAETTVELGSGQSFAIAGLLQRGNTMANSGVNGLRDIPVLGALFGSDRYRRNETELVIIITPYLVRPVSDPQALAAPTDGFRPATDLDRILFRRQLARGLPGRSFRSGVDAGFILE
ncbi:fimbriae assembly protein [Siccirubricoccus deserti]|uniref:Type II and III secretion system protein family protein n=1 Tax=Siccirubricoccus deserti TaxID=2013562 RepID=A0A9X0R0Q7_9PROT|nr:type II and III secretion system protein family protein [Siccirubricoccus deserti]MBC4016657.1 type II and III secretion system protein family protein [Siccirubricoccus deserti]GGC50873.1 fimbriae assembly protein [Siccirubricoccus deserti]